MNTKSLFQSKTFWVNLLGGIVTAVGTYSDLIPAKYAPVIMCAGGIANILLRTITNQGVTVPGVGAGSLKMFVLVALLGAGVLVSSCATFKAHDPFRNPDGSLNVEHLLYAGKWGIEGDCAIGSGAIAQTVCEYGRPAFDAATAAYRKDPVGGKAAALVILTTLERDVPESQPYVDYVIKKLGG